MQHLSNAFHIRVDVKVTQHYPLRLSRAAATKNNSCKIVHSRTQGSPARSFDQSHWRENRQQHGLDFFAYADGGENIFQPNSSGRLRKIEFGFRDEQSARHDGIQACLFRGEIHSPLTCRVIKIDRGSS